MQAALRKRLSPSGDAWQLFEAFGPQFLTLRPNSRNPERTKFLVRTGQLGKVSLLHSEGELSTTFFFGFHKKRLLGGLEGRFILKVHFVSLNFC